MSSDVSIDWVKKIFHSSWICLKGMINAIVSVTHKNEVCIEKRNLIVTLLIIIYYCFLQIIKVLVISTTSYVHFISWKILQEAN